MKKPLDRLNQFQAGLALTTVVGAGLGSFTIGPIPILGVGLLTIAGTTLLALLIAYPIGLAAEAIITKNQG